MANNNDKIPESELDENVDESEEGDDYIDEDEENGTDQLKKEKIVINSNDRAIKDLITEFNDKTIYVPDFQRNFVWKIPTQSKLVESVLMGLPIPPIFLAEDDTRKKQIIDGQQRLTTLANFYINKYKLSLNRKNPLSGKTYADLKDEEKMIFNDYTIRVITLKKESDSRARYELFERLNRGSVKINDQEIRNCLFKGPYMDKIKELAKYPDFVKAVNSKAFTERMEMEDLVSRFGALIHKDYKLEFKGSWKEYLRKEMDANKTITPETLSKFENEFKKCVSFAFTLFGENTFKRYTFSKKSGKMQFEKKPNKSLFEAMMYSFARYDKNQLMAHKDEIKEGLLMILTDNERFNDLIAHHTNAKDRFLERMKIWNDELDQIITTPHQPRCFNFALKLELFTKNKQCALCKGQIADIDDSAIDHINPYWRGGSTIPENAQLTHRWCNQHKSGKVLEKKEN